MHRRVLAALGATTVAASVIAAGTMSADAATPRPSGTAPQSIHQPSSPAPQISPNHPWTINYHDSAGNVSHVWHGTKAAASALGSQWRASHAGTQVARPGNSAIVKTKNCREPTTYWVFFSSGMTCYAYGGSLGISLSGVYQVDSGNNVGYYRIGGINHHLARYTSDFYSIGHTVVFIHID